MPKLITYDIFGTVLDWRRGLSEALRVHEIPFDEARDFDKIVDAQGEDEQISFRTYKEITARSLNRVLDVPMEVGLDIGSRVGEWPLYPEAAEALRAIQARVPCTATTNSDRIHGEQVQKQLGFRLSHWFCAEDLWVYKPNPEVWLKVSKRLGLELNRDWWHVSAYANYDLVPARELGLTTIFIKRPHSVAGPADMEFSNLTEFADTLSR